VRTGRIRTLRVLLLIPNLAPGGAESQLFHLARGLAERGDEVTLAAMQRVSLDTAPLRAAGVRVLALGAQDRTAKVRSLGALVRLARRADVVHCALWDASLFGRLAALAARTPMTVAEHSADRSMQTSLSGAPRAGWIAWHHRLLAPVTAATVACGHSQLSLLAREGVPPERTALIPNGVPVEEMRAAARAGGVTRRELGVPDDALLVAHVARLTPEKNQAATVVAVARLREELAREVHAVFVGGGADRSAPERAAALGADWAHFPGPRGDVPALLALADLAVLPSLVETLPMAALEAMAVGVPQVVADVGDLGALVAGSGAGRAVPAGNPEAFVAACAELLTDAEARARTGAAARSAAPAWDVAPMVGAYAALLAAAAGHRPLPAASSPFTRPGPR
jgi:glycosyltransferase involved in cell wall biosynthesis